MLVLLAGALMWDRGVSLVVTVRLTGPGYYPAFVRSRMVVVGVSVVGALLCMGIDPKGIVSFTWIVGA